MIVASGLLALIVGGAFLVMLRAVYGERDALELSRHSESVLVAARTLERLVIDLETGERGFLLTDDERFLQPWTAARAALPDAIRDLEGLARVPRQQARAEALAADITSYVDDYSVPVVEAARRGDPAAMSVTTADEGKRRVDAVRAKFDQLRSAERALAAERQDRADVATDRAVAVAVAGLVGSVVLVVFVGIYLSRAIVLPVRRAAAMSGRLAGGDLAVRMPETGVGEIGTLERSFNAMASSLEAGRAELTASRARVVAAGDEARQRIERDLHDGTQQRLVSLGLELRAADAIVPPESDELRAQLARAAEGLAATLEELQEVSRGIHPAILNKGGLGPALKALARRSAMPVELDIRGDRRLPEHVEVAVYYVVSEAITNAAKHADASLVRVDLEVQDSVLRLAVQDDGAGGADPVHGSGLVGLRDRVEAIGGDLELTSPPGEGTSLHATIPVPD
ncbi:MAG: CHASE3 domain-containing protein [Candidatus Limnocylindrales bacterium]